MASTEARELDLVKKVELRIALAESDKKLEALLGTYLAPLLLKLDSEHNSVRQKVIGVCQHLNVRLQSQAIKLPVEALLKQAKANRTSSLLRNFDLTFIQKGLQRLGSDDKAKLLPDALHGIRDDASLSFDFGAEMFNIILRLLQDFFIPARGSPEDFALPKVFDLARSDSEFMATWIGKLFLASRVRTSSGVSGSPPSCPGLTSEEVKFLTLFGKRDAFDPTAPGGLNLTTTKVKAAKLLASALFDDQERFLPAICAASNTNSDISSVGEDILKRAIPSADLEDENTVAELFELFAQERGTAGGGIAPVLLRIRVLSLLAKSTRVTESATRLLTVISNGLFPKATSPLTAKELGRLRAATMQFLTSVLRTSQALSRKLEVEHFIFYFMTIIAHQQWPKPGPDTDLALRRQTYEVIGACLPMLQIVRAQMTVLEFLFDSLALDASGEETALSIQEAILTSMRTFGLETIDDSTRARLTDVLLRHIQPMEKGLTNIEQIETRLDEYKTAAGISDGEDIEMGDAEESQDQSFTALRSASYVSLRYANRCLPYHDSNARWIDILAIGSGMRPEVIDEGRRGLDLYWYRTTNADVVKNRESFIAMPKAAEFVHLTAKRLSDGEPTTEDIDLFAFVRKLEATSKGAVRPYLNYLRQLLFYEGLSSEQLAPDVDRPEWTRSLDSLMETSREARNAVSKYLLKLGSGLQGFTIPSLYARLAMAVSSSSNQDVSGHGIKAYSEFLALSADSIVKQLPLDEDLRTLGTPIQSNNRALRNGAAHSMGLLLAFAVSSKGPESERALKMLDDLSTTAKSFPTAIGADVNRVSGALLTLAYAISRASYRGTEAKVVPLLEAYTASLIEAAVKARDSSIQESALIALGQLAAYQMIAHDDIVEKVTSLEVIGKVAEFAARGNEHAIRCLGLLSISLEPKENSEAFAKVETALYALHEIKETESQFAVGEALSILACGWESTALAPKHDVDGPLPTTAARGEVLSNVIDHVIGDCKASKPSLKRAGVIWLLSLVQFCGHRTEIQHRLRDCQYAFKLLLSDKQELVQEAASRGLGLVYAKGDRSLKDDLVRDLVGSFTDNKSQLSGSVTEDTEMFDAGALPTGDGSITTYKDILSLAAEVGNPSLVYRFMSLAANNSIWSSRAAFGRFGLSNVLSDSSVDGYLAENPKLYPKLFRYRFDPNPNVRRSMNDIWGALVKDSSATIDRFFGPMIEDLLQNMLGKEWRVRQASCDATADLVQGRPYEKVEPYVGRIWEQCFKVLDDIKGSVREAAASLARTMTGILIRSLEAGDSAARKADGMLKHVIPFLLSPQGLESSAEEVQFFAIETLLQIIKKSSGKILRPYIPGLIERLLALFSSLENQIVNYLHMNASKYKLTESKIDDMRLMAVRQSPLMEASERCLDLLDEPTMQLLVPRLENAIKTAIGLPSQVACSRVLVSMSTRHNQLFRPHADRFLKLTQKPLTDRNETVALSYAEAAGYVTRVASDDAVMDLLERAKKLYFSSEDDKYRVVAGDIVHAMAKHATDRFNAIASAALPFVFVAKHDNNTQVADLFKKTWDESVGGSRAVLLYLQEIVNVAKEHLESPKWVLKHASARAIADAASALATGGEEITLKNAEIVWPSLVQAMGGKTWEGKEEVLDSFVKFVAASSQLWKENAGVASEITKIVTREAKRQNLKYRPFAVRGLGKVAAARSDISMLDTVFSIASPVIKDWATDKSDDMDVDEANEDKVTADLREKTLANAVEALQNSLRAELLSTEGAQKRLPEFLELATAANASSHSKVIATAIFDAVKSLGEKMSSQNLAQSGGAGRTLQTQLWSLLSLEHFQSAPEAFRLKRAQAVAAVAQVPWDEELKVSLSEKIKAEAEAEKSPLVKQVLNRVR